MKTNFLIAILVAGSITLSAQNSSASYHATVYAEQSMTENAADESEITHHLTKLTINTSTVPGTVCAISVYANKQEGIAGTLHFDGTTLSMPDEGGASLYASNGQSDVVTVTGSQTSCVAYLLPVDLPNGVTVTAWTTDGKYYSQNFSEKVDAGSSETLTISQTTANNLWMTTIPGNTYFSMLSMPGAHDAATKGVSFGSAAECQDLTLQELLDAGVRIFDFRPGYYYNTTITEDNLYIYHGQISTGVLYKDAMKTLCDFVKDNPTEALAIVMVKENCCPSINIINKWTDRSDEMWDVIKAIQERYKDYMKVLDHSYYTLDDFRGKICYFNRTGTSVPYTTQITNWPDDNTVNNYSCVVGLHNANVQDKYNTNGEAKQSAVKDMLQWSGNNTHFKNMHFNYSSSANSPKTYAESTNPVITEYLNGGNVEGPTGFLLGDYMGSSSAGGADYLKAIIKQNHRYVYKGRSRCEVRNVSENPNLNTAKGWHKVKHLNEMGAKGYYYAIVDKATGLMLSYGPGVNQGPGYMTMYYRTGKVAEFEPKMLWKIVPDATYYNGFTLMSAMPGTNLYIQTEWNAAYYCRTHDNGGGDMSWCSWIFAYDAELDWWTIENGKYPSTSSAGYKGYIGPWKEEPIVDGAEVAANKSGDYIGHFEIYAIPKSLVGWSWNAEKNGAMVVQLDDATGFSENEEIYASKVSYSRTMSHQWGTIVLPFDFAVDEENQTFDFYQITSIANGNVVLSKITGVLYAGTPALMRRNAEAEGVEMTANDIVVHRGDATATAGDMSLVGTYRSLDITAENGYILSNNYFWSIQSINSNQSKPVQLAPFRAYLASVQAVSDNRLGFEQEEAASAVEIIDAIISDEAQFFDLQGMRYKELQEGINLIKIGNQFRQVIIR